MAVIDHLRELRRRLIIIVIFVGIGAVVGWYLYPHTLAFLKEPYCNVPAKYRVVSAADPTGCDLIYNDVLGGFTARLKISVISGMIFTAPFWLYQVWAFITPGLKKNERKYTLTFLITSSLLFIAGVVLAFLLLYKGLQPLLQLSGDGTAALLTVTNYITFVVLMLVVFGFSFELPVLVVLANFAGVLPGKLLKRTQRLAIFLIFTFAAVATPTTDPFTMLAMAIPMVLFYECAVLIAIVHDRRKAARNAAAQAELLEDDLVPSTIDPIPRQWTESPEDPESDQWTDTT